MLVLYVRVYVVDNPGRSSEAAMEICKRSLDQQLNSYTRFNACSRLLSSFDKKVEIGMLD